MNNTINQDKFNALELRLAQLEKCVQANAEIHAEYIVFFEQKFKDRLRCIGELHKRIDKLDERSEFQTTVNSRWIQQITDELRSEIKALRGAFIDFTVTTIRQIDIISDKLKIRWTE